MVKKILSFLLILLALTACRFSPNEDAYINTNRFNSYLDLFDSYWLMMNKDYAFWFLDSPNNEWDSLYEEYRPKFDLLTSTPFSDEKEKRTALYYFYEIANTLSDRHYNIEFDLNNDGLYEISFSPIDYDLLKHDFSNEEIFSFQMREIEEDVMFSNTKLDFYEENARSIMENTLSISFASLEDAEGNPINNSFIKKDYEEGECKDFSRFGYVAVSERASRDDDFASFSMFLGRTNDDILYFLFSDFSFYYAQDGKTNIRDEINTLLNHFISEIEDESLKGVVIDLRGNGGGSSRDHSILWSSFFSGRLNFAEIRYKATDNRTSYGPWLDAFIDGSGNDKSDLPIAIITNSHSASSAEIAEMIFLALRDQRGYNVKTFGSKTAGANGAYSSSDILNEAGVFYLGRNMRIIEAGLNIRYFDGTLFESIGIDPDERVDFSYSDFSSGRDARFDSAFSWIRTKV